MSNELPWKVWTPDDLAPPMAEFVLADHSETPLSEEAEEPQLSAEQQLEQQLAQLQMQAHEQGYNAGLAEGRQKGHEQGYQEGLSQGLEQGQNQARAQHAPIHARMQQLVSEFQNTLDALDSVIASRLMQMALEAARQVIGQTPIVDNAALIAAMIAHHGEAKTEEWLRGVKANLARKATGGDRDVARDILGGICDIGLANSYYVGHMKNAKEGSDARQWGDAIKVVKPTFENGGTHVNISGAAVARYAPNKADAVKLMEYLVSAPAQQQYAKANFEYPVLKGVTLDPVINATIGEIDVDKTPLTEIVKYRKQASLLVDKVGFDQ